MKRLMFMALTLALIIGILMPAALASAAEPLGSISGTVYENDGITLILGATVSAFISTSVPGPLKLWAPDYSTVASDGHYTLSLPAANYKVVAVAVNHERKVYNNVNFLNQGTDVVVTAANDTAGINFSLRPGGTISGQISGASPAAGVSVMAGLLNMPGPLSIAVTDGSGNYTLDGLSYRDDYVVIAPANGIPGPGDNVHYIREWYSEPENTYSPSLAKKLSVSAGSSPSGINFALETGNAISGRVTDTSGSSGLGLILIQTVKFNTLSGQWLIIGSAAVTTFAGPLENIGNFQTNGLPPGYYAVRASVISGSAYATEWYNGAYYKDDATSVNNGGGDVSGIDFALEPGGSISGYVGKAADGSAVPNCQVFATDFASSKWVAGLNTDASGNYTLNGLPAGSYRIEAWAPGYERRWYNNSLWRDQATAVTLDNLNNQKTANFALGPGGTISGTVSENGTGIPGIKIGAGRQDGDGAGGAQTNGAGQYTINGLPLGTYTVTAPTQDGTDYIRQNIGGVVISSGAPNSTVDFNLELGASITGTISASEGGAIAGAGVGAAPYGANPPVDQWWANTDAEGHYSLIVPPNGTYRIHAWANNRVNQFFDGQFDWNAATSVSDGQSGVDFVLDPSGSISGTIRDKNSNDPIPDVSIDCWRTDGEGGGGGKTDANGDFIIYNLPYGHYNLASPSGGRWGEGDNGYLQKVLQDGNGNPVSINVAGVAPVEVGDLLLEVGATISGKVTAAEGGAIAGANIGAAPYGANPPQDRWWVNTDANGDYSLIVPAGGAYCVHAWANNRVNQYFNGQFDWTLADEVAAGDENVDFLLDPSGSISGVIRDIITDDPIPNVSVDCWRIDGIGGGGGKTDQNGVYTIYNLPYGNYNLASPSGGRWGEGDDGYVRQVLDQDDDGNPDAVNISGPDTVAGQDFYLVVGATITGNVSDGTGSVQGASVSACPYNASSPNDQWWTNTDVDGNYSLIVPQNGTYRVHAGDGNHANQYYSGVYDWTLADEVASGDVDVDFLLLNNAEWNNLNHVGVSFSTNFNNNINNSDSFLNRSLLTNKSWDSNIYNNADGSGSPVTGVISTLDSTIFGNNKSAWPDDHDYTDSPIPTWTFDSSIAENNGAKVDVWLSAPEEYSPGVDIQRAILPRTITGPAGEQITRTMTVTVTPEADDLPQVDINIFAPVNDFVSPSIDADPTHTYYTFSGEGTVNYYHIWGDGSGTHLDMGVNKPENGRPITLTVALNIDLNQDCTDLTYMPDVTSGRSQNLGGGTLIGSRLERSVNEIGLWTWEGDDSYLWQWNEGVYKRMTLNSYVAFPPVIDSISPDTGSKGRTLDVAISGQYFFGATSLSFGDGITVNRFDSNNDNRISANITIGAGAPDGPRDVGVTALGGTATLSGGFTVAPAAGIQMWKLDSSDHPAGAGAKVMEKTGTQEGSVPLGAGDTFWLANVPAGGDVSFSGGLWQVFLKNADLAGLSIQFGGWDADAQTVPFYEFTQVGSQVIDSDGCINVQTEYGVIKDGDYLALKVSSSGDSGIVDCANGNSFLKSPESAPGYPVPEASALILLTLGIAGLVAFITLKRKRA